MDGRVKTDPAPPQPTARPVNRHLLAQGAGVMRPFAASLAETRQAIEAQAQQAEPGMAKRLRALAHRIDRFEPSVTLIGQVKAGKTALANALSGQPGLLPSDVNPWTSVVTSLHINATAPDKTRAQFQFFDDQEWGNLVKGGGRLGELADRAGADDDLEKLRRQIDDMRANAQKRLSGKFEALLGKAHRYGYVDTELIQRYVCVGDPDDIAENAQSMQGRFSDITRSADIWLDVPELGSSLLVRDTPGVNDTFLVREQITINALRRSKVCVAVLSAHEALNTTDLALVRLVSSYQNRQVILFVNRIDELSQPSVQVPEIRDSIERTLKTLKVNTGGCLLFGSALWAEMALTGDLSELDLNEDARAAFDDWAAKGGFADDPDPNVRVWHMSGMPALLHAIQERIVWDAGKRHLESVVSELKNIRAEQQARESMANDRKLADHVARADAAALRTEIGMIGQRAGGQLDAVIMRLSNDLHKNLTRIRHHHVNAATDDLVDHLRAHPGDQTWTYNSARLRMLLWSAHDRFAEAITSEAARVYADVAARLTELYPRALGLDLDSFRIEPPQAPTVPAPVGLGKTIAVDLGTKWWSRWFQRRREIKSHAQDYRDLINQEIRSMVDDLQAQLDPVYAEMRSTLTGFVRDQTQTILDLLRSAGKFEAAPASAGDFGSVLTAALAMLQGVHIAPAPADDRVREDLPDDDGGQ